MAARKPAVPAPPTKLKSPTRRKGPEDAAKKQAEERAAAEEADADVMADAKAAFDEAADQGFFGEKVDPYPNEAYSLESGPDSPGVVEAQQAHDQTNS